MPAFEEDDIYRNLILDPIRTCLDYTPKMGKDENVTSSNFISMYQRDPLYHWVGFDSPVLYAIHKSAGGMTSLYRQLGIGVERLARTIIRDGLSLTDEQVNWSYDHMGDDGKIKKRQLDARIDTHDLKNQILSDRVEEWMSSTCKMMGVEIKPHGVVFEIREGYKSADSKRQNADIENSANALAKGYVMTMMVMSTQINETVLRRYRNSKLLVLRGTLDDDPHASTFAFFKNVIGYDLVAFFERNTEVLREEVDKVLNYIVEVPNE